LVAAVSKNSCGSGWKQMQQPTGIGAAVNINGTGTEKTRGRKGRQKAIFKNF